MVHIIKFTIVIINFIIAISSNTSAASIMDTLKASRKVESLLHSRAVSNLALSYPYHDIH